MKVTKPQITSVTAFTLLACASLNVYAESGNIGGSSTMTITQEVTPIANADGHILMLATGKGTLKSNTSFMEGANVDNKEVAQLFQGNGTDSGYYTLSNNDGSAVAKWSGTVATVMKEGNPMTSFKGKWEYVGGSGKYQNIKGNGDYNGYFTAQTTSVINWKGHYSLDK